MLGVSALLLKAKIHSLLPTEFPTDAPGICSDISDSASALDSSLAKKPKWILDMFGLDGADTPMCQRMFLRRNPEKKRPGPVWVFLNASFLNPVDISIWLDGRELSDVLGLEELLCQIGYESGPHIPSPMTAGAVFAPAQPRKKPQVLISFLDHYILEVSGYGVSATRDRLIEEECRQALRLALLVFDCVYVPAVSYVQSPLCKRLLDEHRSQARLGAIKLISDAPTWREFFDVRRGEYTRGSKERALYSSLEALSSVEEFPICATEMDTTRAIHREWLEGIQGSSFREQVLGSTGPALSDPERDAGILKCAAEDIGSRAFIARHLGESLTKQNRSVPESRLTRAICDLFFSHFRSHIGLDVFDTLAYVQAVRTRGSYRAYSYGEMIRTLRSEHPQVFHEMLQCHPDDLWNLRKDVASLGFGAGRNSSV